MKTYSKHTFLPHLLARPFRHVHDTPCASILRLLAVVLTNLFSSPIYALDSNTDLARCRVDIWTATNGLPARNINAIAQTPDGYLWLGTSDGLVRFDGNRFRVYKNGEIAGMSESIIKSLSVSREGELWLGTSGDGCGTFKEGVYSRISLGNQDAEWGEADAILQMPDGSMRIGGLLSLGSLRVSKRHAARVPVPVKWITAFLGEPDGSYWFTSRDRGLFHCTSGGTITDIGARYGISTYGMLSVERTADGSIWVASGLRGVFRIKGRTIRNYTTRDGLLSNSVNTLRVDRNDNLWIGTSAGLCRWQTDRIERFGRQEGLVGSNVTAIFEDFEENLWVGTEKVLHRFRNTVITPLDLRDSHSLTECNSCASTSDGSLWMAAENGLLRYRNRTWKIYDGQHGLPDLPINSISTGIDGSLLIACHGKILNFRNERFETLYQGIEPLHVVDAPGGIVFNSATGELYRLTKGRAVRIAGQQENGFVQCLYRDRNGDVWSAADVLTRIRQDGVDVYSRTAQLGAKAVAVDEDRHGVHWFSTDSGILRLRNGKFTLYGKEAGLPQTKLLQVAADDQERVWFGCNQGIFAIEQSQFDSYDRRIVSHLRCKQYGESEGINVFPTRIGPVLRQGNSLWFPGPRGLTEMTMRRPHWNTRVPNILIEEIRGGSHANPSGDFVVAPGENKVEFQYTATSLSDSSRVQFKYKLQSYDKDWVDAGNRRIAYYANLPPGSYVFRVTGSNNDNVWNNTGAIVRFTVQPQFWQTIGFIPVCVLTAGLLIWIGIRYRLAALQRNNRELEQKVLERTQELKRAKDDLEAAYGELSLTHGALTEAHNTLASTNGELKRKNDELASANARLASLATTDGMTGLANHRAFQERIRIELEQTRRTGGTLALLLLDVDRFKQYNDTFGHPAGDVVLKNVGQIIRESVREYDLAARYGGEEFAVLLPGKDRIQGLQVAERIRRSIEKHHFAHRTVTVSIGLAESGLPPLSPELMVRMADDALYTAKRNGRNKVAVFGS